MSRNLWIVEEDNKLKELLLTGKYCLEDIAKIIGRTKVSCLSRKRYLNLKNYYIRHTHNINENFWEKPNPTNCYFAGISAADSCIYERKMKLGNINYRYTLELKSDDLKHLELLRNLTEYTGPIRHSHRNQYNKIIHTSKLAISNRKWINDLMNNFNIIPRKTKRLKPPDNLSDFLYLCYLRGFTDGDGCIRLTKENNITLSFYSCSYEMILWVKDFIDRIFPFRLKENRITNIICRNNCYSYSLIGIRPAIIIDFLNTLNLPGLDRNGNKQEFSNKIEELKTKYKDFYNNAIKILQVISNQYNIKDNNISQISNLVVS